MLAKKFYIFLLLILFKNFTAQFIRVNDAADTQSGYTPEDLIKKVLIGCSAANVSNVKISNQPYNPVNRSYGYFNSGNTNFPFKEGIVISTGYAKSIGNNLYGGILDDNLNNGGDSDLTNAIGVSNLVDASYIEFDFVPTSDKITFRYIFASEEYNAQPCKYDDGFALLLKKYNPNGSTTNYTNLAVLPNGDAVKVTNIHPDYNFSGNALPCPAINANYFGGYNSLTNTITNFDGYVVPLIAESTVVPNEKYHLKIVLADSFNYRYDSGVFLEAGSFNSSVYITGNLDVCTTGSTNLTAHTSVAGTYQWYKDGVALSGETSLNLNNVTLPGVYTFEATTTTCNFSSSVTVTGNSVNIATPQQIDCDHPQITLDATSSVYSNGATFQWNATNGGNIVSGANTLTPIVDAAGTYTLTINGSCSVSSSVVVTKDITQPIISLTASKTKICSGDSVTLTAFGAQNYVWDASSSNLNSITVNPTQTTTYQVYGIGSNGCHSNPKTITIQVIPAITSTLADVNLCNGQALLDAGFNSNYHYQWYFNGNQMVGQNQSTLSINSIGKYSVEISNGTCSKTFIANVLENKIIIATPKQLTCKLIQTNLDASTSVLDSSSIIQWTTTNGGNIVSGANTLTPVINSAGTYTLHITGNCTLSQSIIVTEDKLKPIIFVIADKSKICKGQSVTLTASGATSYIWSSSSSNSNIISVNPTQTTTYQVFGTGANGCTSNPQNITIEVLPEITSTLSDSKTCNGDEITLDAGFNANYTYTWYFNGNEILGEANHDIKVKQTGIYKVKINNGSCSKEFFATVTQPELPKIQNIDYQNNTLTIAASGNGILEYQITGNPSYSWQESNVFKNLLDNSQYQVQVRIKGTSCIVAEDYFTLMIPNLITPNGDEKNDVLDLSEMSLFDNFNFYIYDRYGKELFHGTKENPSWNGSSNGRTFSTGTYWYHIKYNFSGNEINKTGWILLKSR